MSSLAFDPVDAIMEIMETSFEPEFGEAWNRRQVSDALVMGNCRYILLDDEGRPAEGRHAAGFVLSRKAADEEELLLIAVRPEHRRLGIGGVLIDHFLAQARLDGSVRVFLEMREGNPAGDLYRSRGFVPIGRRRNYYNRGIIAGIDAITFALELK